MIGGGKIRAVALITARAFNTWGVYEYVAKVKTIAGNRRLAE
jgi:hypothetical protein